MFNNRKGEQKMTRKYGLKLLVALAGICLVTATAASAATVEFRILANGSPDNYTGAPGVVPIQIQARIIDNEILNDGTNTYIGGLLNFSANLLDSTGIAGSVLDPVQETFLGNPTGKWGSTVPAGFSTHQKGLANTVKQTGADAGTAYDVLGEVGAVAAGDYTTYGLNYGGGTYPSGTTTGDWATISSGSFNYAGGNATLSIIAPANAQTVLNNSFTASFVTDVITNSINFGAVSNPVTVGITTPPVQEGDWTKEPGWNNGLHHVTIAADGSGGDGGALSYSWTITKPGGPTMTLDATTASFDLYIQELIDKFGLDQLPPAYASGATPGSEYYWDLTVTATDGTSSDTSTIAVFVPEPTTMALLGFGVVGLIKRRRRA